MESKGSTPQRMLQTLAVVAMIFTQVFIALISPPLVCYIIFATKYWWICVLYIAWCLIIEKDAEVTGARRSEWVRSWLWWVYAKNYYPLKVVKLPSGELDRKRNYLFCYFPHGMLATGALLTSATDATEFQKVFPYHTSYLHTAGIFYVIPILRQLTLAIGCLSAKKKAIGNILSKQGGGNISSITIGGAQEAYFCNPGIHKVICKKRQGFIKIALANGAPLVPVYVFGESELFSQAEFHDDSIFQKLRELVRKRIGVSIILPVGRKDMLGLVPRRKPLTVVVGEPIDVQKNENPTQEQIDHLHQLFQKKLLELFDSQKKYYLKDHENTHLEIC